MKTIGEVLQLATSFLEERKIQKARRLSEELLAFILQMKRLDLYMQFDRPVEESELVQLRGALKRLAKHEPIEYITGNVIFCNCSIAVDANVLIPRPETELLAYSAIKRQRGQVAWDLCTGSGYLGIALKKAKPHLDVTLSDISPEALSLAKKNAENNGVEVRLLQGDLLEPFRGQKADLILCNPPYVSISEYFHLQPSVRLFEPKLALVGGERGIEFYERLASELPPFLNDKALVCLEIGAGQGGILRSLFQANGWSSIELEKDWAGHDRFFFLER